MVSGFKSYRLYLLGNLLEGGSQLWSYAAKQGFVYLNSDWTHSSNIILFYAVKIVNLFGKKEKNQIF